MANKKQEIPLFKHPNGQWCKKVLGKPHYFGTDLEKALKRWSDDKDYLLAGRVPPTRVNGAATVVELANLFNDRCKRRVAAGKMTQRSADDYQPTIKRFIEIVGPGCQPASLTPLDFANVEDRLFEPVARTKGLRSGSFGRSVLRRSPVTVAGDVRRILAFLKWCESSKLIPSLSYGEDFSPAALKVADRVGVKKCRKDIPAADLKAIIEASSITFRPLMLLGINAGIGNLDLADMQLSKLPDLEAAEVWIDLPRGKTGTDRRFVLWPETVEAIRSYLAKRPGPAGYSNADRLFLTRHGLAWVRVDQKDRQDAITGAFTRYRTAAKVERGTFYDLRRTFQTVAAETLDFPTVQHVMGHTAKSNDMSAVYNQHISDDRIRKVCNHVRQWLYGADNAK